MIVVDAIEGLVRRQSMRAIVIAVCVAAFSCAETPATIQSETHRPNTSPTFINKVWRVTRSTAVQPGTLYVFLSEGTLVITSEHSKPALGRWKHEGGQFTMVEESIAYEVDVLNLTATEFRIRSHNPGGAVEIQMERAEP
jgi:hypothetical protein